MIRSENAGASKLSGGVIVVAAGKPDTLQTLTPGKPHSIKDITVPAGVAGTVLLKYGPGTVPHTATIRVADYVNPFPRAIRIAVTGPGVYEVDHRINRIFSLSTPIDPKGVLDVMLRWRAVKAEEGARGILGVLDISHPDTDPGQSLHVRTIESVVLDGGDDGELNFGQPMVPDKSGHPRQQRAGDEGDIVGTFEARTGDPSKNLFQIRCRARSA